MSWCDELHLDRKNVNRITQWNNIKADNNHDTWGYHSSTLKNVSLLGCYAVPLGEWFLMFWGVVLWYIHLHVWSSPKQNTTMLQNITNHSRNATCWHYFLHLHSDKCSTTYMYRVCEQLELAKCHFKHITNKWEIHALMIWCKYWLMCAVHFTSESCKSSFIMVQNSKKIVMYARLKVFWCCVHHASCFMSLYINQ